MRSNTFFREINLATPHYLDGQSVDILNDADYRIYHYTNADACQNILKQTTIRFSDYRFLNDRNEYTYIKEIFLSLLNDSSFPNGCVKNSIMEIMKKDSDVHLLFHYDDFYHSESEPIETQAQYYIFSTSLEPDSLAMWNYYMKNGKYEGYNLALNPGMLFCSTAYNHDKPPFPVTMYYGEVLYDPLQQKKHAQLFLNRLFDSAKSRIGNIDEFVYTYFNDFFKASAFFFKRPEFSHEKEFRLLLKLPIPFEWERYKSFDDGGFFIRNGVFVPYYDIRFDRRSLREIIIAPTMEEKSTYNGLRRLLDTYSFSDVTISTSKLGVRY